MDNSRSEDGRKMTLKKTVGLLAQERGFDAVSEDALEALTDMLTGLLFDMGRGTKVYTEHAGRVQPTVGDFTLALVDMGLKVDPVGLKEFAHRPGRPLIAAPEILSLPQIPSMLASGKKLHLPNAPSYYPPLPDPRTYVRTPLTQKDNLDNAECREKKSQQKLTLERSLCEFAVKKMDCYYPFPGDKSAFPLLPPRPVTYLDALIPKNQFFEDPPEMAEDEFNKSEKLKEKKLRDKEAEPIEAMEVDITGSTEHMMDVDVNATGKKIKEKRINPYLKPAVPRPC